LGAAVAPPARRARGGRGVVGSRDVNEQRLASAKEQCQP
jgi:hypothetical protein